MKKILLLGAIALSLNSFAQAPNYLPSNGLVGWWGFNANANDESGNGNDGTVNGATLTTDRFGTANSAYDFDGVDDWVEVNNSPELSPTNGISISIWAKTSVVGINTGLIGKFNNPSTEPGQYGLILNVANDANKAIGLYLTPSSTATKNVLQSPGLCDNGIWNNYIATWDGQNMKLYFNGVFVDSTECIGPLSTSTQALEIGRYADGIVTTGGGTTHFTGELDDIGIWSRALTQCEIQDLYSAQLNSTYVSAGPDQTICNGDALTLSASSSMNYSWDNGITDGISFIPASTQDYTVTADSAGCASSDVVIITVNQSSTNTINETATDTYTSPSGVVYTTSGVYNDTTLNSNQCDSIITINLTVDYTGVKEFSSSLVNIYPNPASNKIRINGLNDLTDITKIEITSITGAIVRKENITNSVIDISMLDSGMYLLFISHENGFEKISFLKE